MITGILVMGALSWGLVNIFRGPVGQALAKRIHGGHGDPNPELATELFDLKTQVEGLQQRLAETEERLDFSERLLANRPEPSPPETPR
ncbi:MAG: hypothetical protein FJ206_14920 [Gemmatimonadetes bacterium]|nr:hypothetical protein [Gemmatimonadota bacterium]